MLLDLIAQLANLIPDKLPEPNQDRSAVTQGATGCNLRIFTELSLVGKTRNCNSVNTNQKLYVQRGCGLPIKIALVKINI